MCLPWDMATTCRNQREGGEVGAGEGWGTQGRCRAPMPVRTLGCALVWPATPSKHTGELQAPCCASGCVRAVCCGWNELQVLPFHLACS